MYTSTKKTQFARIWVLMIISWRSVLQSSYSATNVKPMFKQITPQVSCWSVCSDNEMTMKILHQLKPRSFDGRNEKGSCVWSRPSDLVAFCWCCFCSKCRSRSRCMSHRFLRFSSTSDFWWRFRYVLSFRFWNTFSQNLLHSLIINNYVMPNNHNSLKCDYCSTTKCIETQHKDKMC